MCLCIKEKKEEDRFGDKYLKFSPTYLLYLLNKQNLKEKKKY